MYIAWAMLAQSLIVKLCSVALVLLKVVLRVLFGHFQHIAVTGHLGEDRRRRDIGSFRVAFYNELASYLNRTVAVAVDKRKLRLRVKLRDGSVHGEHRSIKNI